MVRSLMLLAAAPLLPCFAATPTDLFRAIRANELAHLKELATPSDVNAADGRGMTPLHYAAAFGNVQSVELLLAAGADVNARNIFGATPLILGASSPEKVRVLLAAGADPKVQTKAGRTALHIAAGRAGMTDAVRLLLDRGADIAAADENGSTPLLDAAFYGDTETVKLLLARGADAKTTNKAGMTTLMGAVGKNDLERVRLFLDKGADVNAANTFGGMVRHGKIALTGLTPLILAAPHGSQEIVRTLLKAGAKVNVRDGRGLTPLMAAIASENQDPQVIKALLEAGADANAVDEYGQSVLDWATRSGHASTVALLETAGAKSKAALYEPVSRTVERTAAPDAAALKAIALLQKSATEFFNQTGCVGCHHQPSVTRAELALNRAGLHAGDAARLEQVRGMTAMKPFEPALLQFIEPGGEVDTVGTSILGFHAAGIEPNSLIDAGVNYIAGKQLRDGSWTMRGISRVPIEDSEITRTALAVRVLRAYSWPARQAEFDERIRRARAWLLKAEPRTSYERADLLLGLHASGAAKEDLARAAAPLLRNQKPDGGWAQNRYMAPDAYATGLALYALSESGLLLPNTAAYRRGVQFLLRTQLADGSWYVRSRAPKFQPYFQSGFPHDHDQWISAAATAYAVMALAPASTPALTAANARSK